jgi:hypothetical protein
MPGKQLHNDQNKLNPMGQMVLGATSDLNPGRGRWAGEVVENIFLVKYGKQFTRIFRYPGSEGAVICGYCGDFYIHLSYPGLGKVLTKFVGCLHECRVFLRITDL